MTTQTQPRFDDTFHRHGYFFRAAAMLTISLGVVIHVLRDVVPDVVQLVPADRRVPGVPHAVRQTAI
jgi:hypothetical protein